MAEGSPSFIGNSACGAGSLTHKFFRYREVARFGQFLNLNAQISGTGAGLLSDKNKIR